MNIFEVDAAHYQQGDEPRFGRATNTDEFSGDDLTLDHFFSPPSQASSSPTASQQSNHRSTPSRSIQHHSGPDVLPVAGRHKVGKMRVV